MGVTTSGGTTGALAPSRTPLAVPRRLLALRSDAALAERYALGDEAAFAVLYERYRPAVLSVCMGVLGGIHDAEDVTQESFSALALALRENPPRELRPWLSRVARNRAIDLTRRGRQRALTRDGELPEVAARQPAGKAELAVVFEGIRELPENQRTALLMRELGGHSYSDIADLLETHEDAVRGLIARARVGLRSYREGAELPCAVARASIAAEPDGRRHNRTTRRHLRGCPSCRAYRAALRDDARALRAILPIDGGITGTGLLNGGFAAGKGALVGAGLSQLSATCAASVCAAGAVGSIVLIAPIHRAVLPSRVPTPAGHVSHRIHASAKPVAVAHRPAAAPAPTASSVSGHTRTPPAAAVHAAVQHSGAGAPPASRHRSTARRQAAATRRHAGSGARASRPPAGTAPDHRATSRRQRIHGNAARHVPPPPRAAPVRVKTSKPTAVVRRTPPPAATAPATPRPPAVQPLAGTPAQPPSHSSGQAPPVASSQVPGQTSGADPSFAIAHHGQGFGHEHENGSGHGQGSGSGVDAVSHDGGSSHDGGFNRSGTDHGKAGTGRDGLSLLARHQAEGTPKGHRSGGGSGSGSSGGSGSTSSGGSGSSSSGGSGSSSSGGSGSSNNGGSGSSNSGGSGSTNSGGSGSSGSPSGGQPPTGTETTPAPPTTLAPPTTPAPPATGSPTLTEPDPVATTPTPVASTTP